MRRWISLSSSVIRLSSSASMANIAQAASSTASRFRPRQAYPTALRGGCLLEWIQPYLARCPPSASRTACAASGRDRVFGTPMWPPTAPQSWPPRTECSVADPPQTASLHWRSCLPRWSRLRLDHPTVYGWVSRCRRHGRCLAAG